MRSLALLCFLLSSLCCQALLAATTSPSRPASDQKNNGIPPYRIYEENDLDGSSEGLFITSSPDGRIFFGTEGGIHEYDGSNWERTYRHTGTRDKLRSLLWTDDELWAGAYGTIGRMEPGENGRMQYRPINQKAFSNEANEFYSSIHRIEQLLYFVGESSIVVFDLETEAVTVHETEDWIKASTVLNSQLLVAVQSVGLLRIDGAKKEALSEFSQFVEYEAIHHLDANSLGDLFFATASSQLYRLASKAALSEFKKVPFPVAGNIRDIEFINDSLVAISKSSNGVFVFNSEGQLQNSLEKSIDYRWAAADKLHADRNGTLWTTFNNTVGKALVSDPVTLIDERLRPSLFYPSVYEHENKLYLLSNGQLLKADYSPNGVLKGFSNALPMLDLSVSTAVETKGGFLFHGEQKSYLLKQDSVQFLGNNGRIDRLRTFRANDDLILATGGDEIKVLERSKDSLKTIAKLTQTGGFINKIDQDSKGVFWLEFGLGKVGRCEYRNGALSFELFTQEHGLPTDWITLWNHEGEMFFNENSGTYAFNESTRRFETRDIVYEHLDPDVGPIHRLATDPQGNIWGSQNNHNYILWKQADGTYLKDNVSLSQLGEMILNVFKFLDNGDAILASSTEVFSVNKDFIRFPDPNFQHGFSLLNVSNTEGSNFLFRNLGNSSISPALELDREFRSALFEVASTSSNTLKRPSFRYSVSDRPNKWSKWSFSNEILLARLHPGSYVLTVQSRHNDLTDIRTAKIPFTVTPTVWETPLAYLIYIALAVVVINLIVGTFTNKLKRTNEKLEHMVKQRTAEIETKNSELQANANELSRTLAELRSAQDLLMATSRKAGMAEVATNVLHNVGNVLNSINVGVLSLSERLEQERVTKLSRVSDLINQNEDQLGEFLTKDPKGKAIPAYLTQLSNVLLDDFSRYQVEVDCIQENIEHIKKIIATQQTHAKTVEVLQTVNLEELIASAIELVIGDLEHSIYEISTSFEAGLEIVSDKHSILQMVTNFIKNSKESIQESDPPLGLISVKTETAEDREFVRIHISDNGIGISEENKRKIFTHGFTTKKDGHGFGMHSCANAAKALGGDLQIDSEGLGKGATVTLTLPVSVETQRAKRDRQDPQKAAKRPISAN